MSLKMENENYENNESLMGVWRNENLLFYIASKVQYKANNYPNGDIEGHAQSNFQRAYSRVNVGF